MAESELGVLSSQCLDRGIPDKQNLIIEIAAWENDRNANHARPIGFSRLAATAHGLWPARAPSLARRRQLRDDAMPPKSLRCGFIGRAPEDKPACGFRAGR